MARLFTGLETIENWSPLDDLPPAEFVPSAWNGPWVQKRMAEAWKTLGHMPAHELKPRAFGRSWPAYRIEWHDLLALIGAGVSEVEALYRQMNRTRILPSAKDISHMEQAIFWPMTYLDQARQVLVVNVCARIAARNNGELDTDHLAREIRKRHYGGVAEHWQQLNWKLCDKIADGLIMDRVVVQ